MEPEAESRERLVRLSQELDSKLERYERLTTKAEKPLPEKRRSGTLGIVSITVATASALFTGGMWWCMQTQTTLIEDQTSAIVAQAQFMNRQTGAINEQSKILSAYYRPHIHFKCSSIRYTTDGWTLSLTDFKNTGTLTASVNKIAWEFSLPDGSNVERAETAKFVLKPGELKVHTIGINLRDPLEWNGKKYSIVDLLRRRIGTGEPHGLRVRIYYTCPERDNESFDNPQTFYDWKARPGL